MPSTATLPAFVSCSTDSPLHYTEAGTGDILLLIHGSLCDYRYWRWQLPALSQQIRTVAPSLRGYWPDAIKEEDPSFSITRHAQDLIAFINEIAGDRPVHVLGHSRGAQVAVELACRVPERIRSLTLADPGFALRGEALHTSFQASIVDRLVAGEVEEALATFVDTVNGTGTWRKMVGWFKSMVRDNAYTLVSQVHEAPQPVDLAQMAKLACPLLLIGGEQSPARYHSRLDALQAALPGATRVTIPMAAHGMNLANPVMFNRVVAEFLASTVRTEPKLG